MKNKLKNIDEKYFSDELEKLLMTAGGYFRT